MQMVIVPWWITARCPTCWTSPGWRCSKLVMTWSWSVVIRSTTPDVPGYTRIGNIVQNTHILNKKYVLQCLQCMRTSGLRFAFWCVLQPLAKSDTFLPAGGASAQTETGLSCPRFLQLFSCSLLLRGTHSGCMYLDGWKVKWFAFMFF